MLIDVYNLPANLRAEITAFIIDPCVLVNLATDEDSSVRYRVAKNPNTPPEILEVLASDVCFTVLKGVAENPKTPSAALEKIINKNFSTYLVSTEFVKNSLIKTAKEHPNYKKSVTLDLSQSQLAALKNLIDASSDPHLQELFN
jgi:hypothetical protein